MTAPDPAKKLAALVKTLRDPEGDPAVHGSCEGCEFADRLVWGMIFGFMAWEAPVSKAEAATRKLHSQVIDYNEMRVCLADELVSMIGDRYPRAVERVQRLRATLNDLYRREHAVSLTRLVDMPKRDVRAYLDSLEGMPEYVSARLTLLSFGGHAFPMDERLYSALVEEAAAPEGLTLEEASGWFERQFRAGEAAEPFLRLEAWSGERPAAKPALKPSKKPVKKEESAEKPKPPAKPKKAAKS